MVSNLVHTLFSDFTESRYSSMQKKLQGHFSIDNVFQKVNINPLFYQLCQKLQAICFQKQHFHEAETHIFGHLSGLF